MIKDVSETIQNEAKKQEVGFLGMLLGTIGASLWGNSLRNKRGKAKIPEKEYWGLVKEPLEQVKARLELVTTFNVA